MPNGNWAHRRETYLIIYVKDLVTLHSHHITVTCDSSSLVCLKYLSSSWTSEQSVHLSPQLAHHCPLAYDMEYSTSNSTGPPPFNDPRADLVLQSCDGVNFRVFRTILAQASPFFDTTFSLPQPHAQQMTSSPSIHASSGSQPIPIVPVTEDSATLDCLLRICYPTRRPSLDQVWHVERVVEAAKKYQMDAALRVAEEALMRIAETDALGVYATACRFELKDAAQTSARMTLRMSVSTVIETLMQEGIQGEALRSLLEYRESCCVAAQMPTRYWTWTDAIPSKFWMSHACCTRTLVCDRMKRRYQVQPWWLNYMHSVHHALADAPWEGVVDAKRALAIYMSDGRGTCGKCLAVSVADISSLADTLKEQIARQVSEVSVIEFHSKMST